MSGILRLESLTKGNTLKQGDKTPLKYRLFDADGEKLNIAGKSAKVRLVYPDFLTIGYEKDGLTVTQDDTVTFTIDQAIPARIYHVEIIVDGQFVFPSRADEAKFTVDKSSLGADANIIEIVGKDVLIQAVKSQVDTELQPLVTSLESAEQAETQRASAESSRASAEAQRNTDHANRSAELAGKADKVVIENLASLDTLNSSLDTIYHIENDEIVVTQFSTAQRELDLNLNTDPGYKYYTSVEMKSTADKDTLVFTGMSNLTPAYHSGSGEWETLTNASTTISNPIGIPTIRFLASRRSGDFSDDPVSIRKPILINLTETFGAGNEPTKEEMDEFIKVTGYIDSENGLHVKDMLGYLMSKKANKKQEDWIEPTLLNGWTEVNSSTTPVRFMKDEFGFVHLKGQLQNGLSSNAIFALPSGYRPANILLFLVYNANRMEIDTQGRATPITANGKISLTGITFKAEG